MTPEEEPRDPAFPKPWYYRPEYLIPMFVFWPAGALLVVRSPWNNNVMLGGVAWAVIIVGAFAGFKWLQAGAYQPIMMFYVPGVLLTLVTQVQWAVYSRQTNGDAGSREDASPEGVSEENKTPRPSARRRRRNSKSGRSKS